MKKRAIMMDIETLSTSPDAVILSFGAVVFDPTSDTLGEQIDLRISIDDQNELGRDISESTLDWWSKQDEKIQEEAFSDDGRIGLVEFSRELRKFFKGAEEVWSQGSFDHAVLENLFKQMNEPAPWPYYAVRDSRTLFGVINGNIDRSNHHSALGDAIAQAEAVQRALSKIDYRGEPI